VRHYSLCQTFQSWSNFLVLLKFELCRLHYWISFPFPTKL